MPNNLTRCPACDTLLDENKECRVCGVGYSIFVGSDETPPLPDIVNGEECGVCGAMMTGTFCQACKMPESDFTYEIVKHKKDRMVTLDFMRSFYKTKWLGLTAEEKHALKKAYEAIKKRHIYDSVVEVKGSDRDGFIMSGDSP